MPEDAKGPARPKFAESYPESEELDRLLAYLARGNHRAVRDGADALASRTDDPRVAAAARDLRSRIEPDPIARVLLGTTLILLLVLMAWAIRKSDHLRSTPSPAPPVTVQTVTK